MSAPLTSAGSDLSPAIRSRPVPAGPAHVLMTLDSIGGVWRYAMDIGAGLSKAGIEVTFAGFGPPPGTAKSEEAREIGRLVWLDMPLDWTARDESELAPIPDRLAELVQRFGIDLVHLNLPTQASGLKLAVPVVAMSHSCVTTWFHAVRGTELPPHLAWHKTRNLDGLRSADLVVTPSASHARMLHAVYGEIGEISVVHNAVPHLQAVEPKEPFAFAAGRWWDEGKNGGVLDEAARTTRWPIMVAGGTTGPDGQSMAFAHARHLGEVTGARARVLLGRAAIVVSPSVYEPFGLVALEAATAGAALVLADIPTYRELWDDCALFVDPRDAGGVSSAIDRLAGDADLRAEFGRRARERARSYSQARQVKEMRGLYEVAVTGRTQAREVADLS